jgi:Domain of unknown function (DUF4365)
MTRMRASQQEQTGGVGVSETMGAFERIGWGPARNEEHDLGTDLWLAVRDVRRFDLGMMVGAQVKGGPSWFGEPKRDNQGALEGWWFRYGQSHFDYWLQHKIPHLVVLYDLDERLAYWVHVTNEAVIPTGVESKILIPKINTVDYEHLDDLIEVAASGLAGVPWEGSIWKAGAAIPLVEHLRHALMVPRLIAPHPNAGRGKPITADQAVAMLMQARLGELARYAMEYPEIPAMTDAPESEDWNWRFAGAVYARVTASDIEPLIRSVDDAPTASQRAVAGAAAASALIENCDSEAAIDLIDPLIASDEHAAVDQNWLRVQRARAHAEIGQMERAHEDAIAAQGTRALAPHDATAGAVSAATAVLLFNTAAAATDLETVFTSADTASGWWRSQGVSNALGHAHDQTFERWGGVDGRDDDGAHDQLAAAEMTASHTGDQAGWSHLASRRAKDLLIRTTRHADPADAATALSALRMAGDHRALVQAIQRLADDGPALAVTVAAAEVSPATATRTTAHADLSFAEHGGDLFDEPTATRVCTWALKTLRNPEAFVARTRPSYAVHMVVLEALAGVVRGSDPDARRSVAEVLLALEPQEQVLATKWAQVVRQLPHSAWNAGDADQADSVARQHSYPLDGVLLGVATRLGSDAARQHLLSRVASGSYNDLNGIADVRELDDQLVKPQIATLAGSARGIITDAQEGHYGIGVDAVYALTLLDLWHPDVAEWEPVLEVLASDAVSVDNKSATLTLLAEQSQRIPGGIRTQLIPTARRIAAREGAPTPGLFPGHADAAAEATTLGMALGAFDAAEASAQVTRLLTGSTDDRYWAAVIAGRGDDPLQRGALLSLIADNNPHVRAAACAGLARIAAQVSDPIVFAALRACAEDPGRAVAIQLAYGLGWIARGQTDEANEVVAQIRQSLQTHPSAFVRHLASDE